MKPIPNWPDYFADKQINIYSMKSWGGYRGQGAKRPQKPRKLTLRINGQGYYVVHLQRDKQNWTQVVGRLMLETFVGPCPENMQMCHGPKGKLDDSLENLYWGTRSRNQGEDRLRDGTDSRGEKAGAAKLTCKQVLMVRSLLETMPQSKIAERLGVSRSCIVHIACRHNWAWL